MIPRELYPYVRFVELDFGVGATTTTPTVGENADRWGLIWSSSAVNDLFVSIKSTLGTTQGHRITPGNMPYIMSFAEWGATIASPWFVRCQIATVVVVTELIIERNPPGSFASLESFNASIPSRGTENGYIRSSSAIDRFFASPESADLQSGADKSVYNFFRRNGRLGSGVDYLPRPNPFQAGY